MKENLNIKERFRPTQQHTHNKSKPVEQKQFYSVKENNWKTEERKQVEYFRCGRKSHIKRDCHVNLEEATFVRYQDHLPKWTRPVKINGSPVLGLIDTGCTKSVVHPRCMKLKDYLSWNILYCTVSTRKVHFPASKVTLTIEG